MIWIMLNSQNYVHNVTSKWFLSQKYYLELAQIEIAPWK